MEEAIQRNNDRLLDIMDQRMSDRLNTAEAPVPTTQTISTDRPHTNPAPGKQTYQDQQPFRSQEYEDDDDDYAPVSTTHGEGY